MSVSESATLTRAEIETRVRELGNWFHNIDLQGVKTAPDHFLGDYPTVKWSSFKHAVPADLTGMSVLDIGCNGGFYSIEMKKRGAARVLAIDSDEYYLEQARFAASVHQADIEFRRMSIYEAPKLKERFDLVIFMGVLYHLRHPLLALDLLYEHVTKDLLLFQSMQRGSKKVAVVQENYPFLETEIFHNEDFPRMQFIEHQYSNDCTNWWVPNRACVEAMLRSSGFEIIDHPEDEVYLCRRRDTRSPEVALG